MNELLHLFLSSSVSPCCYFRTDYFTCNSFNSYALERNMVISKFHSHPIDLMHHMDVSNESKPSCMCHIHSLISSTSQRRMCLYFLHFVSRNLLLSSCMPHLCCVTYVIFSFFENTNMNNCDYKKIHISRIKQKANGYCAQSQKTAL